MKVLGAGVFARQRMGWVRIAGAIEGCSLRCLPSETRLKSASKLGAVHTLARYISHAMGLTPMDCAGKAQ